VTSIAFTGDGRHFLTGSWDRSIHVFDGVRGLEVCKFEQPTFCVTQLAVSPDGRTLGSGGGLQERQVGGKWTAYKDQDFAVHLWRLPESVWPKAESTGAFFEVR
jgi:WD40 repeat protein